jgi:tRNA threonylcarbamoyladenosine biosynthesis protein TsaB
VTRTADGLAVSIDTASELAGVALSEGGVLLGAATWRTRQNHSRELLPTLEWLLQRHQRAREAIAAVSVCTGPGSYAGLRVGLSTAKALAFSLETALVGIGRLAADAFWPAQATEERVVAVQAAGRAELAWAAYHRDGEDGLIELEPPRLGPSADFVASLQAGDTLCGDIDRLTPETLAAIAGRARMVVTPEARVLAVSRLGARRLAAGQIDNVDSLVPLYLRAPAIGPQS